MLDSLGAFLQKRWQDFGESPPGLNEITWLIQSRSRILAFAFPQKAHWPLAVAKISRDEETVRRTVNEFTNLQAVRERLSAPWVDTVPCPVALEQIGNRTIEWERCLIGHPWPLTSLRSPVQRSAEPFAQVYRWLVNFQSACTYGVQVLDDDILETMMIRPLVLLLEQVGFSQPVQGQARRLARNLKGFAIPRVHRHGDLHPTNLLFRDDCLQGVTDWEMATQDSWPFYDWFQFLLEYHLELARQLSPSASREKILQYAADSLFGKALRQEETVRTWTIRFLANYGIAYEVAPLLWLHYAWEVYWPEDKEIFLRTIVPAVVRWAGWDR